MARDEVIDIAKGLGIILVMVGHLRIPNLMNNFIYFFHMPFFVFVSGMYFRKKSLKENFRSGSRLYLSYLIYGAIFLLLNYKLNGAFEIKQVTDIFLGKPEGIWNVPYFETFWFIAAIVVIKSTGQVLVPNRITLGISLTFFFVVLYLQKSTPVIANLPFGISQAAALAPFYILGNITKNFILPVKNRLLWSCLIFLVLSAATLIFMDGSSIQLVNYHLLRVFNPAVALILGLTGSVSLIFLAGHLAVFRTRIMEYVKHLGEYSFIYFALHVVIYGFIEIVTNNAGLAGSVVQTMLMFLTSLLFIRLLIMGLLRMRVHMPELTDLVLLK
jgi:acyltransferase